MARAPDWDDYRHVLAVARHGSLSAAAAALGVSHSTVLRRVAALEEALETRLFDRLPGGYSLTQAGEAVRQAAERMEEARVEADRAVTGRDLRLEGTVRLTLTDTLDAFLVPPVLAAFREAYPGIAVEAMVSGAAVNLNRRDADVALRPTANPPDSAVGRRIARMNFAIYGSETYLARHGADWRQPGHFWIEPDDNAPWLVALRQWMRDHLRGHEVVYRTNALLANLHGARAGLGLALLPCYAADIQPELRRLGEPLAELSPDLWLLTHADLKRSARIRVFMEFVAERLRRKAAALEGRVGGRRQSETEET